MGIQEDVLQYLLAYGKENKYKMATTLKIDVGELTKALGALEQQGKIEMKTGRVIPIKGNPPKTEQGLGEDKPEDQIEKFFICLSQVESSLINIKEANEKSYSD